MMRPLTLLLFPLVLSSQLLLSGCSGCSDSTLTLGPGTPPTSSGTTVDTSITDGAGLYLFHAAGNVSSPDVVSVAAFDIANSLEPRRIAIAQGPVYGVRGMVKAVVNASVSPTQLENAWLETVIFQGNDRLYKASTNGGTTLSVEQISTATINGNILDNFVAEDYSNHANSAYFYKDGSGWFMIKQDFDSTSPPVTAMEPVSAIYNNSTGAIDGWLALDNGVLKFLNSDFVFQNELATAVTSVSALNSGEEGYVVLLINQANIHVFDTSTLMTSSIHPLSGATFHASISDGEVVYFIERTATGTVNVRQVLNSSPPSVPPTPLATEIGIFEETFPNLFLDHTSNYVVYGWGQGQGNDAFTSSLKRVLKVGGTVENIVDRPGSLFNFETVGEVIYYNIVLSNTAVAEIVTEDPSITFTPISTANWYGSSLSRTKVMGTEFEPVKKFLLMNYSSTDVFAGESVRIYSNAGLNTVVNTVDEFVGVIPTDVNALTFNGFGDQLLGFGVVAGVEKHDLFYVDAGAIALNNPNDVVMRLTTTAEASEFLVR